MRKLAIILIIYSLATYSHAQKRESFFRPTHAKIQYAGNIGLISAGVGFAFFKEKAEADVLIGYLPKSIGGVSITTLTVTAGYYPWKVDFSKGYLFEPLYIGGYSSYAFGSDYYIELPDHYPQRYYWWPTALRIGGYIGGRLSKDVHWKGIEQIGFYYQLGTYDLKVVSVMEYLDYFSITDAFDLAFGLRVKF